MGTVAANLKHYDVLNVHYCPGTLNTDGTIKFGSIVKSLPGVISFEASPEGDKSVIRADGINYIVCISNTGYTLKINQVMLGDEFRVDCLAEEKDTTNGIQYENADAKIVPFALMGEFKGDSENIRWMYPYCVATRPTTKGENKDKMQEPDEDEIEVAVNPMPVTIGDTVKNITKCGIKKSDNDTTWGEWYKQVCLPGATITASTGTGS